jgi:hypothetical protein
LYLQAGLNTAADLDKLIAKWNKWADAQGLADYSAWTMTKNLISNSVLPDTKLTLHAGDRVDTLVSSS